MFDEFSQRRDSIGLYRMATRRSSGLKEVPESVIRHAWSNGQRQVLGTGKFGKVLALHLQPWGPVAVKVLKGDQYKEYSAALQEMGICRHENIVPIHAVSQTYNTLYVVMKRMTTTLESLVENKEKLPWELRYDIAHQAAEGLAYIHQNGFVHMDIAPSKLMLELVGPGHVQARWKDCGFAFATDVTNAMLGDDLFGVLGFKPPEYLDEDGNLQSPIPYSQEGDVFAYGVCLARLFSLCQPYIRTGNSMKHLVAWMADHKFNPDEVYDFDHESRDDMEANHVSFVIESCCEQDPQERCTMEDICESFISWHRRNPSLETVEEQDMPCIDALCNICFAEQIDTVFLPCNHFACCEACAEGIMNRDIRECPVCNSSVEECFIYEGEEDEEYDEQDQDEFEQQEQDIPAVPMSRSDQQEVEAIPTSQEMEEQVLVAGVSSPQVRPVHLNQETHDAVASTTKDVTESQPQVINASPPPSHEQINVIVAPVPIPSNKRQPREEQEEEEAQQKQKQKQKRKEDSIEIVCDNGEAEIVEEKSVSESSNSSEGNDEDKSSGGSSSSSSIEKDDIADQLLYPETILDLVKEYRDSPEIQAQAFEKLESLLSSNPDLDAECIEFGIVPEIIASMQLHPTEEKLISFACGVLGDLASKKIYRQSLMDQGGGKEIIQAMENHASNSEVQLFGCRALGNLGGQAINRAPIIEMGGIEVSLKALRNYRNDVDVQVAACRAIGILACCLNKKSEILELGTGTEMIKIIRDKTSKSKAVIGACAALTTLAVGKVHKTHLMEQGMGCGVIQAMQRLRKNAQVQRVACAALWVLASDKNNSEELMKLGVGTALIQCMQKHRTDAEMQRHACDALWVLAANKHNRPALLDMGAEEELIKAAETHRHDRNVHENALRALTILTSTPYLYDPLDSEE